MRTALLLLAILAFVGFAADSPSPVGRDPSRPPFAVGRFQIISVQLSGRAGDPTPALIKLDTATGESWEYGPISAVTTGDPKQPAILYGWNGLPSRSADAVQADHEELSRLFQRATNSNPRRP